MDRCASGLRSRRHQMGDGAAAMRVFLRLDPSALHRWLDTILLGVEPRRGELTVILLLDDDKYRCSRLQQAGVAVGSGAVDRCIRVDRKLRLGPLVANL